MSFDPAAALTHYHAVLDAQDLAGVARALAPEVRYFSMGLGDVRGRDAVLAAMKTYFATSPDHQAFDDEVWVLGPLQAKCNWRLRATNKVTGQVVERSGMEIVTFNQDGLITAIEVEDAA